MRLDGSTLRERLERNHTIDRTTGCWLWTGHVREDGYGLIWAGRSTGVHRVAYELFVGPIPDGHQIDHVYERGCRYRNCINPGHLESVTMEENAARLPRERRRGKADQTHCKRGHPLSGENVRRMADGSRRCRQCERDYENQRPKRIRSRR